LIISLLFGEQTSSHQGLGHDGREYARIVSHFPEMVLQHELSQYRLQRILPLGIIYSVAKLVHFPLNSPSQIVLAFSCYNTLLLLLAVFIWYQIANKLQWSPTARIISFFGIFLNAAIGKIALFNPVLTDPSAFFLGLLLAYYFFNQKPLALLITTIMGAFVFPTFLLMGLLLFLFPYYQNIKLKQQLSNFANNKMAIVGSLIISLAALSFYLIYGPNKKLSFANNIFSLSLSFSFLILYIYFVIQPFSSWKIFGLYLRQLKILRLLVAALIFLSVKFFIFSLSDGTTGDLSVYTFLKFILINSLAYPGIFLVSHITYYGPILLLIIFFWKDFCHNSYTCGLGFLSIILLSLLLGIDPESRQLVNFFPFVVCAITSVLSAKKTNFNFVIIFFLTTLLFSKIWFSYNASLDWDVAYHWYAMTIGPWMSYQMYLINTFLIVFVGFSLFLANKNSKLPFDKKCTADDF
jgi:hypothetical protein